MTTIEQEFKREVERAVEARLDLYWISRWVAFLLGNLVTCTLALAYFIHHAKQTPYCGDGYVGFRIEQCLTPQEPKP